MHKNNIIVATMPIKPQEKTNLGMYIAPILMDVIGEKLQCRKIFSMNLLNTYKNKSSFQSTYENDVSKSGIKYDELFIDSLYTKRLLDIINEMVECKIVKKEKKKVLRCSCGKVDILLESINTHNDGKLYFTNNDKKTCKECGSECKIYDEDVLLLKLNENIDDSLKIVPSFLNKDVNHLSQTFKGNSLLVSKARETGYKLNCFGKEFNVDIDFIWMNYFKLFDEQNQILIASNHQVYQMYIMNYISKISSNKNLNFIANPYIRTAGNYYPIEKFENSTNEIYKKLFILYSLKWRKKESVWDQSIINYISNISDTRKNNLYQTILKYENDLMKVSQNPDVYIEEFLQKGVNLQRNIEDSKKLIREKRGY